MAVIKDQLVVIKLGQVDDTKVLIQDQVGIVKRSQAAIKVLIRDLLVVINQDQVDDIKVLIQDQVVIMLDHILLLLQEVLLRQQQDNQEKQKLLKLW